MEVKRFADAKPYEVPNHRAYTSLRLFGAEAGGPRQFVLALSHFLPGGGAGPDASPTEKVYFILSGELTVIAGGAQGERQLLHRGERIPRDHQPQQRRRDHAGRDLGTAEVTAVPRLPPRRHSGAPHRG